MTTGEGLVRLTNRSGRPGGTRDAQRHPFVRRTDQLRVMRASNGNVYVGSRSAFGDGRVRLRAGTAQLRFVGVNFLRHLPDSQNSNHTFTDYDYAGAVRKMSAEKDCSKLPSCIRSVVSTLFATVRLESVLPVLVKESRSQSFFF